MTESELIKKYFLSRQIINNDVVLSIGDDAAVTEIPKGMQLVTSSDTLVSGVHFHDDDKASDIAYKALAVNLSDMAAMAAEAKWLSLSLTLPTINENWLEEFSQSFFQLADEVSVSLVGGDLCRGPLAISIHIQGLVEENKYIARSTAEVGDRIYVTGTLGDAAAALSLKQMNNDDSEYQFLLNRLLRPTARLKLGHALGPYVNSMIDLSDGLAKDLGHIIEASEVAAKVFIDKLPLSQAMKKLINHEQIFFMALTGGDDYELCFTAKTKNEAEIMRISRGLNCPITCIGEITSAKGLRFIKDDGKELQLSHVGHEHFS